MIRNKKFTAAFILTLLFSIVVIGQVGAAGFEHAPVFLVDGEEYYMAGAPDGPNGAVDVPGHTWVQTGPNQVAGKHYNTGPFGAPQWWSSDAPDGSLLFVVHGIFDTWSPEKAEEYASKGYVHRHELISVADGTPHPTTVVWLKHTARAFFSFDGGPRPDLGYDASPGVSFDFMPNWSMPYDGGHH
jgi:selenium-binding protein 1